MAADTVFANDQERDFWVAAFMAARRARVTLHNSIKEADAALKALRARAQEEP